jgi:hypothetical protein
MDLVDLGDERIDRRVGARDELKQRFGVVSRYAGMGEGRAQRKRVCFHGKQSDLINA